MRTVIAGLSVVALGACANDSTSSPPDDEVAQILAAQIATGHGGELVALADATAIARGGPPDNQVHGWTDVTTAAHDELLYMYWVRCFDHAAKPMECNEGTVAADAGVVFGGVLVTPSFTAGVYHHAQWHLQFTSDTTVLVTGSVQASYDVGTATYTTTAQPALAWDPTMFDLRAGRTVTRTDVLVDGETTAVPATVRFDVPGHAWIELDAVRYGLDTSTGALSLDTTMLE
jgi:hypothetical protein